MANPMRSRQAKYGTYAVVYTLVIIAVLAAINFLANRYTKSWDATANKQFSLADQTKKVVGGLKQDVNINYFDKATQFPQARDLLDRYSALSPRLKVNFYDPDKKPQIAKAAGVRSYGTIQVESGTKKEEAKSLTEEEVTGAIIRSLKTGERSACFVTGSGEHSLDDTGRFGYSIVKDTFERNNIKTKSVNLLQGKAAADGAAGKAAVPSDCTVLVSTGSQHDYPEGESDAIKAFVEGGGSGLFLLGAPVPGPAGDVDDNLTLGAVLGGWGVTLKKDMVLDPTSNLGSGAPLVSSYESQPIVSSMSNMITAFPLSRSLDVKNGDKATVDKLFSTSSDACGRTNLKDQNPECTAKDEKGPLTLGVAGKYNGAKTGRFVVVGSSLWASNSFIRVIGNRDLLLNMVNWLTADEDLISIRPKSPEDRPLNISGQKLNMVFWLSVVIFPLAVVGFGMATWWKRR